MLAERYSPGGHSCCFMCEAAWAGIMALFVVFLVITCSAACASDENNNHAALLKDAEQAVIEFKNERPELRAFFDKAHAYAVYPAIRKLAYVIGFAGGSGVVFQSGEVVGFSKLTQFTYGFTAGIHSFGEVIFFRNEVVFEKFRSGDLDLDAQASLVAGKAAAMASYDFDADVLVFTITNAGLMFDLSLGGQKFSFEPLAQDMNTSDTHAGEAGSSER